MTIIPIGSAELAMDFDLEASTAAVNEACAGVSVECTLEHLCPECRALAVQIKARLVRAFLAGQASITPMVE